jgi:hypothetical protein
MSSGISRNVDLFQYVRPATVVTDPLRHRLIDDVYNEVDYGYDIDAVDESYRGFVVFKQLSGIRSLLWSLRGIEKKRFTVTGQVATRMKLLLNTATSHDDEAAMLDNEVLMYFIAKSNFDEIGRKVCEFPIHPWNLIPWNDQSDITKQSDLILPMPSISVEEFEQLECWLKFPAEVDPAVSLSIDTGGTDYAHFFISFFEETVM